MKWGGATVLASIIAIAGCNSDETSTGSPPDGGAAFDGSTTNPPGPGDDSGTPPPPGSPGTACGLEYGTTFKYVVAEGLMLKVYLDGEIDEAVGTIARDGSVGGAYIGGILYHEPGKILLAGGHTQSGTPAPGFWEGTWPQSPPGPVALTTLTFTGNAQFGPMKSSAGTTLALGVGSNGVYKLDLTTHASTLVTQVNLPASYYITEFLDVSAAAFTVLASVAPVTGTNNRAFTVTSSGATWTAAENTSLAIAIDKPIVAVRGVSPMVLFFDEKGFYINGNRVRDARYCFQGQVQTVTRITAVEP